MENTLHIRNVLQTLLNRTNLTEQQIWSIISALRGPDNESMHLKACTTEVIRYALGFRQKPEFILAAIVDIDQQNLFCSSPDNTEKADFRGKGYSLDSGGYHFWNHSEKAFEALGLHWSRVNT